MLQCLLPESDPALVSYQASCNSRPALDRRISVVQPSQPEGGTPMSNVSQAMKLTRRSLLALSVVMLFGCASESMQQSKALSLTGAEEVPPVSTTGSGSGQTPAAGDRSVSGSITVAGFTPTAAHIHEAGMGKNGP